MASGIYTEIKKRICGELDYSINNYEYNKISVVRGCFLEKFREHPLFVL